MGFSQSWVCTISILINNLHMQNEQGVQGLQAFAFCTLIVNDEHTKQT